MLIVVAFRLHRSCVPLCRNGVPLCRSCVPPLLWKPTWINASGVQNCPLPFFYSLFTREALWISDPVSEVLQESPPFGRGWVDPYGAGLPPPILAYGSPRRPPVAVAYPRSEEHTSELQSLMRNSYAVFCLKKKKN